VQLTLARGGSFATLRNPTRASPSIRQRRRACAATEAVDPAGDGANSGEHVSFHHSIRGVRRDRASIAEGFLRTGLGLEALTVVNAYRQKIETTFRVSEVRGAWRVSRDHSLYGEFLTRGDAVRGACFGARAANKRGASSRVFAAPDELRIDPYEPHFGE